MDTVGGRRTVVVTEVLFEVYVPSYDPFYVALIV